MRQSDAAKLFLPTTSTAAELKIAFPRRDDKTGGVRNRPSAQVWIASSLLAAFSFVLLLAVSPQWHERLHPQKDQHECAVTLIAHGKVKNGPGLPLLVVPQPVTYFATLPALHPIWVEAPFLGASVFEHAPPVVS